MTASCLGRCILRFALIICLLWLAGFGLYAQSAPESNHKKLLSGQALHFTREANNDRIILGSWIEDAVKASKPVDVTGAIIQGDINLTRQKFISDFSLIDCDVQGVVNFPATDFEAGLNFYQSRFRATVVLTGAVLKHDLVATDTQFNDVFLEDAQVHGLANFTGAIFNNDASFSFSSFASDVYFFGTVFKSKANFGDTKILKYIVFGSNELKGVLVGTKLRTLHAAQFHGPALFTGMEARGAIFDRTSFDSTVSFERMHATGTVGFNGTEFKGSAVFENARIDEDARFGDIDTPKAVFNSDVNFHALQVGNSAYFIGVEFRGAETLFLDVRIANVANFIDSRFLGRVTFIDAEVGGRLGFSGAEFKKDAFFSGMQVSKEARFGPQDTYRGARFYGNADFHLTHFGRNLDLSDVYFGAGATFQGSVIGGTLLCPRAEFRGNSLFAQVTTVLGADFGATKFDGPVNFNRFISDGNLKFVGVDFHGNADFAGISITGQANFVNVGFHLETTFDLAQFKGSTRFVNTDFLNGSKPRFVAARFLGPTEFLNIQFLDDARFDRAEFDGDVDFRGVQFDKAVTFESARFLTLARFGYFDRNMNLDGGLDFKDVSFESATFSTVGHFELAHFGGHVNMRGATFGVLQFSEDGRVRGKPQFQGTIDLIGCQYQQLVANRDMLLSRLYPYDRQPYTQLENSLRVAGHDSKADEVYIRRRRIEDSQLPWWAPKYLGDLLWRVSTNYGVTVLRLFCFSIVIVLLGGIIFSRWGAIVFSRRGATPLESSGGTMGFWAASWLSLCLFLPVDLKANPEMPRRHRWYAYFLEIVGWIVVPAFLLVLSGLLKYIPSR